MAIYAIGVIRKKGRIVGYRLFESISRSIKDVDKNSIINELVKGSKIVNLEYTGEGIRCIYGSSSKLNEFVQDITRYEYDMASFRERIGHIGNNKILILSINAGVALAVDKDGTVFSKEVRRIICDRDDIINFKIEDNKLIPLVKYKSNSGRLEQDILVDKYYKQCRMLGIKPLSLSINNNSVSCNGFLDYKRDEKVDSLVLPQVVTSIYTNAFYGVKIGKLSIGGKKIIFPKSFIFCDIDELDLGCNDVITDMSFYGSILREVDLSKVRIMGEKGLYSVEIKQPELNMESLEFVGDEAFRGANIQNVVMKNVKYIGRRAFYNSKVKRIVIGSAKCINISAFDECSNLEELIIPDSVDYIEASSRSHERTICTGCANIKHVMMPKKFYGEINVNARNVEYY